MNMKPLFDVDEIPTRQQVAAARVQYHLYVERNGVRHYLCRCGRAGHAGYWDWLPLDEVKAGHRKRKTYSTASAARLVQRAWQRDAKDGIAVCVEAVEVVA
jgi:hypothetical protein